MKVKVNGKDRQFDGDPEMPLLWVLRDELDLKGTKFGCGMSLCGACTVHLNGQPIRSCSTPVSAAANKSVTTIEGLSGDVGKAVAEAWIRAQAPQCGYCQPGFVMAATSVISADPKQSPQQALSQITNLCRCGTYDAIRLAVGYALASLQGAAEPPGKGAAR